MPSQKFIWLCMLLLGSHSVRGIFAIAISTMAPDFIGKFNKLKFESIQRDEFRISLSAEDNSAATIWAESKNTKSQWQLKVNDLAEHGPAGVPAPVVFALLKASRLYFVLALNFDDRVSLQTALKCHRKWRRDSDPKIDASITSEGLKLKLTIDLLEDWKPEYDFVLSPLELDGMEFLKAQLRDARDEILSLKKAQRECVYLSVSSDIATDSKELVSWNIRLLFGRSPKSFSRYFCFFKNCERLVFRVGGVYQINCRLAQQNTDTSQFLSILVDGEVVAQSPQADGLRYLNAAHVSEILRIEADSSLSVRCGASDGSSREASMNRLSVLLLHRI